MIGFVAAERREFSGLRRHLRAGRARPARCSWVMSGELNGTRVILAANGPGPVLARRAAETIGEFAKLTALVSYGFCGGLNPGLRLYQVVGWGAPLCRPEGAEYRFCAPLSIDRVAGTAAEKAQLRRETGADVIDMESASLDAYARDRAIPFSGMRVITDTAGEDLPMNFNAMRDRDGRFSRSKILAHTVLHPSLFPRLKAFQKRADHAARVLGDFVAGCQF